MTTSGRFLTTVVLLQVSIISLTAAECGSAPTVNLTCSEGIADITWSTAHSCERVNCGVQLNCTNGTTYSLLPRKVCATNGWLLPIPWENYFCNASVDYQYKNPDIQSSPKGYHTCINYSIKIQPVYNLAVGSPKEIHCSVNTVDITEVTVSWTGPNGTTITNDRRLTITPTAFNGTNHISTLQFSYLSEDDEGLYECSTTVSGYDENKTASVELTNFTIPTPNVTVTDVNNQQVGDPLLLECNVTTVRGITSSVDIVWITNGTEVRRASNVSGESVDNSESVVYRNVYGGNGLLLREEDNGIVYHCIVNISTTLPVEANSSHAIVITHDKTSIVQPSPTNTNSAQASSNPDPSRSALIISAMVVLITFILTTLIITCFIYKQRRKLLATWDSTKTTNMAPPFEDDMNYSVIGKEAPSTCEYLENEKVLHWVKDMQMPMINEECASICSGETTNVDMLNLVYGGDAKVGNDDCDSSESISVGKDPYLTESVVFRKNSRSSLAYSVENSPTTINGYVKVDRALDQCYSDHSSQDQTQTTSTTTVSLEGSYTDHYGAHIAPSSANNTANDETMLDSCNTHYFTYEHTIRDYNQTTAASLEGSYINHDSAQMGSISRDQTQMFPLTSTEESTSVLIKDCCDDDDDLPYVALSEDILCCSPLSARSSAEGDLDYSAHNITADSDNNSILHSEIGDYVEDSNAT